MKTRRKAEGNAPRIVMVMALIISMFAMVRTNAYADATVKIYEKDFEVGTILLAGDGYEAIVEDTTVCFYPDPNFNRGGKHLSNNTYKLIRAYATITGNNIDSYTPSDSGDYFVLLEDGVAVGGTVAKMTAAMNPDGEEITNPDGLEIIRIETCTEDGVPLKRYVVRPHQAATVSHIKVPSAAPTIENGASSKIDFEILPATLADSAGIKWIASPQGIVELYKDEACTQEVGETESGLTAIYVKGVKEGEATITAKSDDSIGRESTFKVTVSKPLIPDSEISAAQRPTAKTGEGTEYTGEPITLVNEPTESLPEGYKIKYALTTTETEPAESAYSDTIPTATEPGIYYIWYIIYRDKDGAETKPARLETEIVQPIDADEELHAVFGENLKIKQTRKAIKVSWGKSKNIDKFEVFIAYLGKKAGSTPTATTTANSVSVTKINNKKIDTKKNFSVEVVAYDKKGNKVGTSMKCFIAGKDNPTYTNVKSIKPAKKKITLKKGKKATINATLKLQSSSKKQLPKKYAPDIRYSSSNKKVATVNKKGKITAKGVGKCKIYMYAKNGVAKSITVTVKAK